MSRKQPIPLSGKLVLLGAGKMGGAMMEGWLAAGIVPSQLVIFDPAPAKEILTLIKNHGLLLNPDVSTLSNVDVILTAVKPQIMDTALETVLPLKNQNPLILSIVAGKTIESFEQHFGRDASVIRTIPNTPAAVGRGITAMAANGNVTEAQTGLAKILLASIGEVVTVDDENQIDAVTGLSGSGPAYVFYMTECLAKAGEAQGLNSELAMQLARATVEGAGELMRATGTDAATLRKNVTSPNGTTQAGLEVLMADDGLETLLEKTVDAATRRSRELAD
ncbi:Pyrroline-5-carboxylate reductase [hydrothermal vent metagenome]|uniref:Pyrroline-5-carboxylate reductase n=1 Tax=hydrothermal vent metagenome TaxID=652676 RepID=A0A3B0S0E6_9ZZZZ